MLVLKGLIGLHRTVQHQLLQHYWLGHRLGLLWYWMVCLGNEQIILSFFEIASKYRISGSFVDHNGYSISSRGFLPTVLELFILFNSYNCMNILNIISFYFTGHFHCVQVLFIKNDAAMKTIMSFKHAYIHFCWLYSTSIISRSLWDATFFLTNLFYLEANYFIILWWFLPYIYKLYHTLTLNQPQVYMCPPVPNPPPTSIPMPSLWVIPVHRLWLPCFMHQTWTGHLFHIS